MSAPAVARRYAEALADVAFERNAVDKIAGELRAFAEMVEAHEDLRNLFANPVVSQSEKAGVLDALIARVGPGDYTANLLRALLGNDRLHYLTQVYEQFVREVNERHGVVVAHVTTAAPIGPAERERLARKLREMTGKQVEFEIETDPSLIAGVVTRVGSVVYDGSVRTQLLDIKQKLKSGE